MTFPQIVKINVTGARGRAGADGSTASTYADLSAIADVTVPEGVNLVWTNDGNSYIYDETVDAAFVSANPLTSVLDMADRGFRLADLSLPLTGVAVAGDNVSIVRSGVKRRYDLGAAILGRPTQVSTVAAMTALVKADLIAGEQCIVAGRAAIGDGGGGQFRWDASSAATADGGTVFAANAGGTGRWIRVFTGPIAAAWFNVIGDGSTDDTTAWQAIAAYVNARADGAAVLIGHKRSKIIDDVTFTKSVHLVGAGTTTSSFEVYSSATVSFIGNRTANTSPAFKIEDMAFRVYGTHTSAPAYCECTGTGGALRETITLTNVAIAGAGASDNFNKGLHLKNVPWPRINGLTINADQGTYSTLSQYGIYYEGTDGSLTGRDIRGYFLKDFIYITGEMEGIVIDAPECVACVRGITYLDSTDTFQPLLVIMAAHLNCEQYCVKLRGVSEFFIGGGSDFYAFGADGTGGGTWTAIDITTTVLTGFATEVSGTICDMSINGAGGFVSQANRTGIKITGSSLSSELITIDNVKFVEMNEAVRLDTNSHNIYFGLLNRYDRVTTNLTDPSGNSVAIIRGGGGAIGIGGTPTQRFEVFGAIQGTAYTFPSGSAILTGTGSPEGVVTAGRGVLYLRTDGALRTTLYLKTTTSGNTGWTSMSPCSSGTASLTADAFTNVAAYGAYTNNWSLNGNMCTVSGQMDVTATATGLVELDLALPIASNFLNPVNCSGTISGANGRISAEETRDRARISFIADTTSLKTYSFIFMYQVI